MGQTVEFPSNGRTVGGYLAPAAVGAGPGLIVIQEWWGLVDHIRDVCDRFAEEGFTALAPDLYHGTSFPNTEPDEAEKKMMAMSMEEAARDMSGAIDNLRRHPAVRGEGVGVVGFCMGGGLALWLGTLRPDEVRAVACFYGIIPWDAAQPDYNALRASVQGHYGDEDPFNPLDQVHDLENRLEQLGKDVQFHYYQSAGHAFFNDTRPEAYADDAARPAWVRTLEFLRAKLG